MEIAPLDKQSFRIKEGFDLITESFINNTAWSFDKIIGLSQTPPIRAYSLSDPYLIKPIDPQSYSKIKTYELDLTINSNTPHMKISISKIDPTTVKLSAFLGVGVGGFTVSSCLLFARHQDRVAQIVLMPFRYLSPVLGNDSNTYSMFFKLKAEINTSEQLVSNLEIPSNYLA